MEEIRAAIPALQTLLEQERDLALQRVEYIERLLNRNPRTSVLRRYIKDKGLMPAVVKWQDRQDSGCP